MRTSHSHATASRAWAYVAMVMAALLIAMTGGVEDAAPESGEVVELAEATTITGDRPGYIDVLLPVNTTFATPFGSSPDLAIEGDSAFTGFALIGSEPETRAASLIGGRIAGDSPIDFLMPVGNYPSPGGGAYFEGVKNYDDTFTIASGRYRLYLLTEEGQEATVTLQFGQLDGAIELEPTTAADYAFSQPAARLAGGAGLTTNIHGAGQSGIVENTGLLFQAVSIDTTVSAGGQYVFCYRPPGGADVDPIEAGPGCWAMSPERPITNNREAHADPDAKLYIHAVNRVPAGEQDFGYWGATEAVMDDLTYVQFWLEYEDLQTKDIVTDEGRAEFRSQG